MAPIRDNRRVSMYLLIILQILQARRRRLREERLRRARARLERFRRFFQRQRSEREMFVATLTALLTQLSPPVERRLWTVDRSSVWWDTNDTWSDKEWLDNLRMSRNTFQYICSELEEHLRKETTKMRAPIPVSKRVALTLWRMSTNADYRSIENLFGVATSTTCMILREVCDAIVHKLGDQFVRPPSGMELDCVVNGFENEFGVPQIAGVLNCTQIPILAPPNSANDYCNANGWHCVMLQLLIDNSYCIMDFQVGNKGSVRPAELLESSNLYKKGENGQLFAPKTKKVGDCDVPLFVVASTAYPLRDWIVTPYDAKGRDEELSVERQMFNQKMEDVLEVGEIAMARLKARWRSLRTRNDTVIDFLPLFIQACCVVHNICESLQQPFSSDWLTEKDKLEMPIYERSSESRECESAEKIRDVLTTHVMDMAE